MRRLLLGWLCVTVLVVGVPPATVSAAPPDETAELDVIVEMAANPDLEGLAVEAPRARRRAVITQLQQIADQAQRPLRALLGQRSRQGLVSVVEPLWVINAIHVTAAPSVIAELAGRPDVRAITPNVVIDAPATETTSDPTPNQQLVNADDLWAVGHRGAGVVVAGMDTGVSATHPDLSAQYRGGTNSWLDPHGQHATPFDASGHGTMTMGVMVGRDLSGSSLGTAPEAQWAAVKIFDDNGQATASIIHQGFQWLLDPDGSPATDDAPSVVNNSWALGTPGCNLEFQPDLLALRASGIVPVFSAGNYGPGGATSPSPANNPEALAVGATDIADHIWSGSSRGPTTCGGSTGVFPDVVAPGVAVQSTDLFEQYAVGTGTSLAAPHVAGGLALLRGAYPGATAVELESALGAAAVDLGDPGPDDVFGGGRIDLLAAYLALARASIGDLVFEDVDGDGTRDEGEDGLVGIGLLLRVAGPDGQMGTGDDVTVAERATDSLGTYVFDGLAAGAYRVEIDPTTLPAGATSTTGNDPLDVVVAPGQDVRDADFGFALPPPPATPSLGLSFDSTVIVGQSTFGPEDVVAYDGTGFSLLVDGSDIGLGGRDIDAVHVVDADSMLISLAAAAAVPGLGGVADADLLRFDATALGDTTAGALSMWFDGSDVGLSTSGEDVDAVGALADGRPIMSTRGDARVPGVTAADEDLVVFTPASLGPTTAGTWALWFDGSDVGLAAASENVDGVDVESGGHVRLSTAGAFSVPAGVPVAVGGDESAFRCALVLAGSSTQCSWDALLAFDGVAAGLPAATDIDALAALR